MKLFGFKARNFVHGAFAIALVAGLNGCDTACSHLVTADMKASDAMQREALALVAVAKTTAGDVLIIGGGSSPKKNEGQTIVAVDAFDHSTGKFAMTGSLDTSRIGFVTLVPTTGTVANHVLVAGGVSGKATAAKRSVLSFKAADLDTVESYTPSTGKFGSAPHHLGSERAFAAAAVLQDGTVLITGGFDDHKNPQSSAEIFNPSTGAFTAVSHAMVHPRAFHTATTLGDGTVLIVGGMTDSMGDNTATAEIYHPGTQTFTATAGSLSDTAAGHTATLISGCGCASDGKVLIAGGADSFNLGSGPIDSGTQLMALYDPATETFSASIQQMTDSRVGHTATLLPGGKVLLAGGVDGQALGGSKVSGIFGRYLDSAEIFTASTGHTACIDGTKTTKGETVCASVMQEARTAHTATLLAGGKFAGQVLIAGGAGDDQTTQNKATPLKSTELFNPSNSKFSAGPTMHSAHIGAMAVVVP